MLVQKLLIFFSHSSKKEMDEILGIGLFIEDIVFYILPTHKGIYIVEYIHGTMMLYYFFSFY